MDRSRLLIGSALLVALFAVSTASAWTLIAYIGSRSAPRTIVGVIVENHEDAREHQQGLADALLIQEFLVEGGISRFQLLFDAENLPEDIGPVRSMRPYFTEAALPWATALFYAGGSPEAFALLNQQAVLHHFNGLSYPEEFTRKKGIAAPHNLFTSGQALTSLLADLPHTETLWPPYTLGKTTATETAPTIHLEFGSSAHNVDYTYDARKRTYERTNGEVVSAAHPSNLLILAAPILATGEFGRLTIDLRGKGKLLLFRDGVMQQGTWKKSDAEGTWEFLDESNHPLAFAKGQTWMTVLPELGRVKTNK
jgi:hypothetical protein